MKTPGTMPGSIVTTNARVEVSWTVLLVKEVVATTFENVFEVALEADAVVMVVEAKANEDGQQSILSSIQPTTGAHRYAVERSNKVHAAVEQVPVKMGPEPVHDPILVLRTLSMPAMLLMGSHGGLPPQLNLGSTKAIRRTLMI